MELKRESGSSILFLSFLFLSLFALFTVSLAGEAAGENSGFRERNLLAGQTERSLFRPTSNPPRCSSKCGHCKPCRPVLVVVPPKKPFSAEYCPQVWRCKCRGKLYKP